MLLHICSHPPPGMCALNWDAKNSESSECLEQLYVITSSYPPHKSLPVWPPHEQMEPETAAVTRRLCCLKASWIKHNRSQDNATMLHSIFWRLETLCAEAKRAACVEEGSWSTKEARGTNLFILDVFMFFFSSSIIRLFLHRPLGGREKPSQHNTDENVTMLHGQYLWNKTQGLFLMGINPPFRLPEKGVL